MTTDGTEKSDEWLRYCSLVVQEEEGSEFAIDLSAFRIKFQITQAVQCKPSTAVITVYNVSNETAGRIQAPEVDDADSKKIRVLLAAGYEEHHAMIFDGDLVWKAVGRESQVDTYVRLIAISGGRVAEYGHMSASLPAGCGDDDICKRIREETSKHGVSTIKTPRLNPAKHVRGVTLYGQPHAELEKVAATNSFDFGYTANGEITFFNTGLTYDADEPVTVLSPSTGLIGRPTITTQGIRCRMLINPAIDLGALVQLNNDEFVMADYDTNQASGEALVNNWYTASDTQFDPSGLYRVASREIHGDTRGEDWYMDLVCFSMRGAQTIDESTQAWVDN